MNIKEKAVNLFTKDGGDYKPFCRAIRARELCLYVGCSKCPFENKKTFKELINELKQSNLPKRRSLADWEDLFKTHFGKSVPEISKATGIIQQTIHMAIKRLKLVGAVKNSVRRREFWIKLHNDNKDLSVEEISVKTGINKYTINGGFYRNDLR